MNRCMNVILLPWKEMDQTESEWMIIKQSNVIHWEAFEGFPTLMPAYFSSNLTASSTKKKKKFQSPFVHLNLQGLKECCAGLTNRKLSKVFWTWSFL